MRSYLKLLVSPLRYFFNRLFLSIVYARLSLIFAFIIINCRNAKQLRDYGLSIPWPVTPKIITPLINKFRAAFLRWRAWMVIRAIPNQDWPQLRLKIAASEVLKGQRTSYGLGRRWEGNYVQNELNAPTALVQIKNKDRFQQVLFASRIRKYNKRFKVSDRALLVSDNGVYKLDGKTFKAMKNKVPLTEVQHLFLSQLFELIIDYCVTLEQITALSVSSEDDHLLVIHLRNNNDLVLSLQPDERQGSSRVGEVVGILVQQCTK